MLNFEISWIFLILVALSFGSLMLAWIWNKAEYSWLEKACTLLVITFPFQGFPSLLGSLANLRLSQVAVALGLGLVFILLLKRDSKLLSQKIQPIFYWMLGFILVSIPSWFFVETYGRVFQFVIWVGLVFGAVFLLSHFAGDVWKQVRYLILSMLLACGLATYQFLADLAGLSESLSLLRPQYTSAIFGIPRVHSFFLEPLLFAGGLFFPITMLSIVLLSRQNLVQLPDKLKTFLMKVRLGFLGRPYFFQFFILLIFLGFFVLTYSKSAFFALAIISVPIVWLAVWKYKDWLSLKIVGVFALFGALGLMVLSFVSTTVLEALLDIGGNFSGSLLGTAATAVQRNSFLDMAWYFLPEYILTGAGPGQYGGLVGFALRSIGGEEGDLIINNVYLEVWFEYGLVALVLFLGLWLMVFKQSLGKIWQARDWRSREAVLRLGLTLGLATYLIQWWFFSPLYIMPIFILLGLLLSLNSKAQEAKDPSS